LLISTHTTDNNQNTATHRALELMTVVYVLIGYSLIKTENLLLSVGLPEKNL